MLHWVCERSHKNPNKRAKIFYLPPINFIVDVKYEIRPNSFVNLPKSEITQFPILLDLATTGHKLQGMTKKNLIISSFNYGTANWIYVVLSRITFIKGHKYWTTYCNSGYCKGNKKEHWVCEQSHKNPNKRAKILHLPPNNFIVDVKYEIRPNSFVNLPKSEFTQFPILLDLATTGHKLQGMTKKHLIISSFNYGTANWIYVVLSRVTSIKGHKYWTTYCNSGYCKGNKKENSPQHHKWNSI